MFHMETNYRNAREIFDYARDVIVRHVPDADLPRAVRETGVRPRQLALSDGVAAAAGAAVEDLLAEVEGSIAVVTPARYAGVLAPLSGEGSGRVQVVDPMATKGLEYDATVIVDPEEIAAESPGGARVLYVALTRAAHRMTVLTRR
jgi:DNA helicase IV